MKYSGDDSGSVDLDPTVEALVNDVMSAVDDLQTACIRLENTDVSAILHETTLVTEEFMFTLASADIASADLKLYADRVRDRECRWNDIEFMANPIPIEVAQLKASPEFIWQWGNSDHSVNQFPSQPASDTRPSQRGENVVGPSDWPDDFEDYPGDVPWWAK